MSHLLLLLIGAALANNVALTQLLGVGPLFAASTQLATSIRFAVATSCLLIASSLCNWLLGHLLLAPFGLEFLRLIVYALVIALIVGGTALVMQRKASLLQHRLSPTLLLLTANSAVLGVALLDDDKAHDFFDSLFYSTGTALGFSLVLVVLAALRERLAASDVPVPFRGSAIALITAGLLSLAFMGLAGLA
ncbi:MAG TPA: Rnf-Nqr domain containing protein [Candidatus Acidoferrum sp.]|nr:Rnf-Nqr domain containing protein [Candidatus Acidoferrum sp.]